MTPKRHPVKGEPDFRTVNDEKLRDYVDMLQHLLFMYQQCDAEKHRVLEEIWKDLSAENTERLLGGEYVSADSPSNLLRKVPKVRKSPVKRNI